MAVVVSPFEHKECNENKDAAQGCVECRMCSKLRGMSRESRDETRDSWHERSITAARHLRSQFIERRKCTNLSYGTYDARPGK